MSASWHGNMFSWCQVKTSLSRVDEETNSYNTGAQSGHAAARTQPGASHSQSLSGCFQSVLSSYGPYSSMNEVLWLL